MLASAWARLSADEALTPQLFAGHLHDEGVELYAGKVFANALEAEREVPAHAILPALEACGINTARS